MKTAFVLLAVLALASAACPNRCSGHGSCGGSDKCTCFPNWQGSDCSERTCRFDIAWAADHWNDAHYYAECSAKGLCDRETGECVCFEGYSGHACKRSVCPNDCSGHGKCRLVEELPLATDVSAYTAWDGDKIQACLCDGGFYGPDCSQRYCPKGDDPLTICDDAVNSATTYQVQRLALAFGDYNPGVGRTGTRLSAVDGTMDTIEGKTHAYAGALAGSTIALKFTDNTGETWWTNEIFDVFDRDATGASKIEAALEALPNFRIPAVTVAAAAARTGTDLGGRAEYLITFDGASTSGNQNLLSCDFPLGCTTVGCQPWYEQPRHDVYTGIADTVISLTSDSVFTKYNNDKFASDANLGLGIDDTGNYLRADGTDTGVAVTTVVAPTGYADAVIFIDVTAGAGEDPTIDVTTTSQAADNIAVYISYLDENNVQQNEELIPPQRIPEIVDDEDGTGALHLDIGYGLALNIVDRDMGVAAGTIEIHIPRCTVTEEVTAHAEREDIECSGRGSCDSSSGVCSCYEGFYGAHCAEQTILV